MNRVTAALRRPSLWAATAVSMALIVLMVGLKFIAYHDLVVPLSYVLALLVVLWHRNRWLLWIMAGCFAFSAAHAVVWIAPGEHYSEDLQQIVFLGMHWINIVVAAGVLHAVVNYRERLERSNSELTAANIELDASNEELTVREEEISRQNEELQNQTEELEQQAEQLRSQAEDLQVLNQSLEAKVAERTVELQRRTEDLQRLASQLTTAEQRERRRLAVALHDDLQQLLVAAKIRLSSRRTPPNVSRDAAATLIDQAIDRSRSLTVELSPPVLFQERFDRAVLWLARHMQEKHALEVTVTADADSEPAGEDWRVFLFHAVGECLFNTAKHAAVDRADVHIRHNGERLQVVVEDRGCGFDVAALDGRPKQSENFGLFSLQQRSMLLGGVMNISSAVGTGTRVEFLAPLARAAAIASQPPTAQTAPSGPSVSVASRSCAGDRIRVLLADDHTIFRNGLASILHNEPGIEVVAEAADGQAAVELARTHRPDVVLMDVTMPRLNGVEATRLLTAELPTMKIIGMSMHEDDETSSAMRKAGAVSYLTKGGMAEELLGAIRGAVAPAAEPLSDATRPVLPGGSLDPARHRGS